VRAIKAALGQVDVGRHDRAAQVFQIQPISRQRRGIGLNAHRRFLAAADADQSHAGQLGNLRRQPGVRKVFDLGERKVLGSKGQGQNGRVGRIVFAVNRRSGKVGRQVGSRSIDGLLHFLLSYINAQAEVELQRDDRTAIGARGGHLLQSGHLAELPLQRSGYRRGHHIRAGARVKRDDLDGRVIDLR
jgi:hypothetical protein